MMKPPTLTTERLALVPVSAQDLDTLWALWRDDGVRRFLFDGEAVSRERAAELLSSGLAAARYGLGLWRVLRHGRTDTVGCVGLLVHTAGVPTRDPSRDLIEPLAALLPAVWGSGYASEALAALLAYAQRIGRAHSLVANCDLPNQASHRLLRRLGFVAESESEGRRYPLRHYRFQRHGEREHEDDEQPCRHPQPAVTR